MINTYFQRESLHVLIQIRRHFKTFACLNGDSQLETRVFLFTFRGFRAGPAVTGQHDVSEVGRFCDTFGWQKVGDVGVHVDGRYDLDLQHGQAYYYY